MKDNDDCSKVLAQMQTLQDLKNKSGTPLLDLLDKATAFERPVFRKENSEIVNGLFNVLADGAEMEANRRKPIDLALRECVEALLMFREDEHSGLANEADLALATLRAALEETHGKT